MSTERKNKKQEIFLDIEYQFDEWKGKIKDIELIIKDYCETIFSYTKLSNYATQIELCIILSNNKKVHELNKDFRGNDKPTNVLSFPAEEINPFNLKNVKTLDGYLMLGDIVFAYETIKSEAESIGKTFEEHFFHLLVHGILHLIGFDHQAEKDALIMEEIEVNILAKYKISSPYLENI